MPEIQPPTSCSKPSKKTPCRNSRKHLSGTRVVGKNIEVLKEEEDQNVPLQNMPLWHEDYAELKATEKPQTGKAPYPLPFCLKAGHTFPAARVSSLSRKSSLEMALTRSYVNKPLLDLLFSLVPPFYLPSHNAPHAHRFSEPKCLSFCVGTAPQCITLCSNGV